MNQDNYLRKRERIIFAVLYTLLIIIWGINFFPRLGFNYYQQFYPIPLTMIFGSFIGGFTCEGGGAVAFPVFTKLLHIKPNIARDFSFAIQSIGMSFASLTILLRKIPIEKNVIKFAVLGGILGIIIGTYQVVPIVSPSDARLIFTLVVTSFGVALFLKNFVMKSQEYNKIHHFRYIDGLVLIGVGILGGIFSSIVGTGIHFLTFSFVTLLYKLDEKIATPTSIIIMATDSIFGFAFRGLVIKEFSDQALIYWALCIPIVAFFAPLGAIMCSKVSRLFVVKFLLFLINIEFISTLLIYKFNFKTISLSFIVLLISVIGYLFLIRLSNARELKQNRLLL